MMTIYEILTSGATAYLLDSAGEPFEATWNRHPVYGCRFLTITQGGTVTRPGVFMTDDELRAWCDGVKADDSLRPGTCCLLDGDEFPRGHVSIWAESAMAGAL